MWGISGAYLDSGLTSRIILFQKEALRLSIQVICFDAENVYLIGRGYIHFVTGLWKSYSLLDHLKYC
jgi:hypothetical protein